MPVAAGVGRAPVCRSRWACQARGLVTLALLEARHFRLKFRYPGVPILQGGGDVRRLEPDGDVLGTCLLYTSDAADE